MNWLVLQLADSAFPTGGFAHSSGLEAAAQLGEVDPAKRTEDVGRFVAAALWQVGLGSLPFVGAAHDACDASGASSAQAQLASLDRACDAFLVNHVTNRASRTQGRALLATCDTVWALPFFAEVRARVRARELLAHHAPLFGGALRTLGVARRDALALFLHLSLRGTTSAAVRLGLMGPHEAQKVQVDHAPLLDRVLAACEHTPPDEAAQPAPLLDLFSGVQDQLYSRLFLS